MSDLSELAQYAQIASTAAQIGSTAYSLANRPGTPGQQQQQSAMMPSLGFTGQINDPATVRRAAIGNMQQRGLSGASPNFLQNLSGDPNLSALTSLRADMGGGNPYEVGLGATLPLLGRG